jgi:hypothetical protein
MSQAFVNLVYAAKLRVPVPEPNPELQSAKARSSEATKVISWDALPLFTKERLSAFTAERRNNLLEAP